MLTPGSPAGTYVCHFQGRVRCEALQLQVRRHYVGVLVDVRWHAKVWHDGIDLRIQHCEVFIVAETGKFWDFFFIATRRILAILTTLLTHHDVIDVGTCDIKLLIDYLIVGLLYLTWAAEIVQVDQ
jgi:hypothetical protein